MKKILIRTMAACAVCVALAAGLAGCRRQPYPTAEDTLAHNPRLAEVEERHADDPQWREAARFLLANLPYYYTYRASELEPHLKVYELFGSGDLSLEEVQDSVRRLYGPAYPGTWTPVRDWDMDPALLVENMEWAFKVWREQPWGKNVPFADFCEYILPYRIKDEPLKPWREKLYRKYNPMLDSIRHLPEAEDPLFAARVLLDSVSREESHFHASLGYGPHVGPDLVEWRSGNCRELTDRLTYIFRAVGIPCGCDYMPLRGDANVFLLHVREAGNTPRPRIFRGEVEDLPADLQREQDAGRVVRRHGAGVAGFPLSLCPRRDPPVWRPSGAPLGDSPGEMPPPRPLRRDGLSVRLHLFGLEAGGVDPRGRRPRVRRCLGRLCLSAGRLWRRRARTRFRAVRVQP